MAGSTPPTDPTDRPAAVGWIAPSPLSARNPRVVELSRLSRQRRFRESEGSFVLDGPVLVQDALEAGIEVRDVFVEPDATTRPEVVDAVAAAVAGGAGTWIIQGGLKGHVEPRTPNGVAAVARIPRRGFGPADDEGEPSPALHLVLAGIGDPGNLGTLLRTAEAVGATSVVLTEGSVDPWSPKVVRSSAGSVLRVPVWCRRADEVLSALGHKGVQLVGTVAQGGQRPDELDLRRPTALVLGSEAHGLPEAVAGAVEAWVSLPMVGRIESLNVAVAGSIIAYEAVRQRGSASSGPRA